MSTLPYQLIKGKGYITPEVEKTVERGMSYGLSSCGYDVRAAKSMWLWPFYGRLNVTVEYFNMSNDLVALVRDKSSLARRFIFVQNTVIEPGWRGYLTLELTRYLPWPVKIHAGQPIAQIMFEELVEPTEKPYDGKYQDQIAEPVPTIDEVPFNKEALSEFYDNGLIDYAEYSDKIKCLKYYEKVHTREQITTFAIGAIVIGMLAVLFLI